MDCPPCELSRKATIDSFCRIRSFTDELAKPLTAEDCVIQSTPDVSPTSWHLAHTTWFFETFVLAVHAADYTAHHPLYGYLYNSYYNAVGRQFPRPRRGVLSRPGVAEIRAYRTFVNERMLDLLDSVDQARSERVCRLTELGLHHEQQHQELILTDIKHVLSCNPLYPVYKERAVDGATQAPDVAWYSYEEGMRRIGHDGGGFCYDNEKPRHRVFQCAFDIASRLVSNGEYLDFVRDGGYSRPELWLSDGWNEVRQQSWRSPLYWVEHAGEWKEFTLAGLGPLNPDAPVCHVSYFEADAFARWAGARLATETEWEIAAADVAMEGNFIETGVLHPGCAAATDAGPVQMFGDLWEWTASPYVAYPGYRAVSGALGEYNGKFMCNQFVLRGGSCATSQSHIRRTYRNFFPPAARWQFTGIRLAR